MLEHETKNKQQTTEQINNLKLILKTNILK